MGRGHPPMITIPWRLSRSRESTPNHHRIRPAGKSLTNISPLIHSPIRDDRHITTRLLVVSISGRRTVDRCRDLRHT